MAAPRALACPASLKGVLSAARGGGRARRGLRARPASTACQLPLADGGEGTVDALCDASAATSRPYRRVRTPADARVGRRDGATVVEAAAGDPVRPGRLDVLARLEPRLRRADRAARRAAARSSALGGTANMDAGAGLLEVLDALPAPTTRALRRPDDALRRAAALRAAEGRDAASRSPSSSGASASTRQLAPFAELPGSGAAGGLGAALASLGAELVARRGGRARPRRLRPGARTSSSSRARAASTRRRREGKAPGRGRARAAPPPASAASSSAGSSTEPLPGAETVALSGDPDARRATISSS